MDFSKFDFEPMLVTKHSIIEYSSFKESDNYLFRIIDLGSVAVEWAFEITKKTPEGDWINDNGRKRWVNRKANKRYAYYKKKDAWDSYIKRKLKHLEHINNKKQHIESVLQQIKDKSKEIEVNCPRCHRKHVDKHFWEYRPHKTHYCFYCNKEWKPFDYYTRGIK